MLNTFLQIGQKLRDDTSSVQYLPFVGFGEKDAKTDLKGNIIREKPFVQVYDVIIKNDKWEIKKSHESFDENTNITFIKGDNNDRFYIAGDIHGKYFGRKVQIKSYYESIEKGLRQALLPEFIINFRKYLYKHIESIEKQIRDYNKKTKNGKMYIQFRFIENSKVSYWEDKYDILKYIGDFILEEKYIDSGNVAPLAKRTPVSFFTSYNLNSLQNLDEKNSYKILDIRSSQDVLKSIIVADKYISGKEARFGRAVVQVLPTGDYTRESLLVFLSQKVLKRNSKIIKETKLNKSPSDIIDIMLNPFEKVTGINKYDVLFLNKGGQTTDMVAYISSISKSDIENIKETWKQARRNTKEYYQKYILPYLQSEKIKSITYKTISNIYPFFALNQLLRGFGEKDKKLEKYHRFVLYKIFRRQYNQDPLLLKALINRTEYGIRNNDTFSSQFLTLFINYLYLNYILVYNELTMIQKTQSYKAGQLLGTLARNLDQEINSFSKQYAGNISRRIATKEDLQKLLNFIHEKLVMHDKAKFVRKDSVKLNDLLANFTEQYKKDYAVAGFFYSYMMPFKKSSNEEKE